jgi:predicted PhzF superfamily epimerase YddE/YHI9
MELTIYQVDAFAEKLFGGNPAAVIPLESWIDEGLMQKIALENNLAETVFFVKNELRYDIRWFTPNVEVDICGHATLASAYVLFNLLDFAGDKIDFYSHRSGLLSVTKKGDLFTLDFPTDKYVEVALDEKLLSCFQETPIKAFRGRNDFMLIFSSEKLIREMQPDFRKIGALDCRGVIVTAKGESVDFVSRWFGPQSGVDEDPATGSAHTTLVPYWREILGKDEFKALQVSARCGSLSCKYLGDRVEISGHAVLYMVGKIFV